MTTDKAAAPVGAVPQDLAERLQYVAGAIKPFKAFAGMDATVREAAAALASQAARMAHYAEVIGLERAAREAAEQNAARYRWLRDEGDSAQTGSPYVAIDTWDCRDCGTKKAATLYREELDAAIDKLRGEAGHG